MTPKIVDGIVESLLNSVLLFSDIKMNYKKVDEEIDVYDRIGPRFTTYDIKMMSTNSARELSISLVDYGDDEAIFVSIYNRAEDSSELDLKRYLVESCGLAKAKNLMRFKSLNMQKLENNLNVFFKWLDESDIESLSKILKGESWADMPYDWR